MNLRNSIILLISSLLITLISVQIKAQNTFDKLTNINDTIINYSKYEAMIYGPEPNPTNEPIGGGLGYSKIIGSYTYLVRNKEELFLTINKAKSGDTIYIIDTAAIDLSESPKIIINGGVILASGRGNKGSQGAILFSNNIKTYPMLCTSGERVRITGLRLYGPDTLTRTEEMRQLMKEGGQKNFYSIPISQGIRSDYKYTEVDNCEIMGWSHAAIFLYSNKDSIFNNNYIHHNFIHHNQRSGLGYGVCLDNAQALIEANIFDYCRHAIAGTGTINSSYEARFNIMLENFSGHPFDMHGGADRNDGTNIAGNIIKIHHNLVKNTSEPALILRGIPMNGAEINNNIFYKEDAAKDII